MLLKKYNFKNEEIALITIIIFAIILALILTLYYFFYIRTSIDSFSNDFENSKTTYLQNYSKVENDLNAILDLLNTDKKDKFIYYDIYNQLNDNASDWESYYNSYNELSNIYIPNFKNYNQANTEIQNLLNMNEINIENLNNLYLFISNNKEVFESYSIIISYESKHSNRHSNDYTRVIERCNNINNTLNNFDNHNDNQINNLMIGINNLCDLEISASEIIKALRDKDDTVQEELKAKYPSYTSGGGTSEIYNYREIYNNEYRKIMAPISKEAYYQQGKINREIIKSLDELHISIVDYLRK
jgi:hypothetical protein